MRCHQPPPGAGIPTKRYLIGSLVVWKLLLCPTTQYQIFICVLLLVWTGGERKGLDLPPPAAAKKERHHQYNNIYYYSLSLHRQRWIPSGCWCCWPDSPKASKPAGSKDTNDHVFRCYGDKSTTKDAAAYYDGKNCDNAPSRRAKNGQKKEPIHNICLFSGLPSRIELDGLLGHNQSDTVSLKATFVMWKGRIIYYFTPYFPIVQEWITHSRHSTRSFNWSEITSS